MDYRSIIQSVNASRVHLYKNGGKFIIGGKLERAQDGASDVLKSYCIEKIISTSESC